MKKANKIVENDVNEVFFVEDEFGSTVKLDSIEELREYVLENAEDFYDEEVIVYKCVEVKKASVDVVIK